MKNKGFFYRLLSAALISVISQFTFAQQQFQWTQSLYGTYSNKISIDSDINGNLYVTRNMANNIFALLAFDPLGEENFRFYFSGCTPHSYVIDIEAEADGSAVYILTLETGEKPRVSRVDETGAVNWTFSYGNLGTTYTSASPLAFNNNRLMLGINSAADINSSIILDIDKTNGSVINSIHQKNVANINSMDLDDNNELYVTGNRVKEGGTYPIIFANDTINFDGDGAGYNFFAAKYGANNENIWANVIDEHNTFINTQIESDNFGNAFLTGELLDVLTFGSQSVTNDNWVYDFFLTKIDPSGNFIWAKSTPSQTSVTGDVSTTRVTDNLTVTPDGFASLSTVQRGLLDWGNGIVSNTSSIFKYLLCVQNYDPYGALLSITLADTMSHDFTNFSGIGENPIVYDNNDGYYVAGNYSGDLVLGIDTFLVDNTNQIHQFITKMNGSIVNTSELSPIDEIIFYPNPTNNELNIDENFVNQILSIQFSDAQGRFLFKIDQNAFMSGKIDVSNLEEGMYTINVRTKYGERQGRIIKQ